MVADGVALGIGDFSGISGMQREIMGLLCTAFRSLALFQKRTNGSIPNQPIAMKKVKTT